MNTLRTKVLGGFGPIKDLAQKHSCQRDVSLYFVGIFLMGS